MQKRRLAFINRIRTQHKDSIKNCIRRQLLQQCTAQNTHKYSPFVTSSYSSCIGDKEEQEQAIRIFEDGIVELLKSTLTYTNIGTQFVSKALLDAFTTNIKQATSQNDLGNVIQCYKQGLNLLDTLRQRLSFKLSQSPLNENPLCYIRQWQNTYNLVLFRIKISKMAQDSHSQYVDSQLNIWNMNTLSMLSDIWEADQAISSTMIHQNIKCILIEISQLFILLSTFEQDIPSTVDEVFNYQMIKHLSFLLRLHFVQDEAKAEITELFLQITKAKWDNIYKRVLANDYIDYIRMVIAYEEEYKQTNHNNNNKIHKRIVNNMLQFIVQGSYLASSDQFWEKGLCSELLAAQKQGIKDKNMRYNIITALFVCITSFTYQRTLTLIQETPIFEWVLQIINEMIDSCYGDQLKIDIITDGIYVLRFFCELGEQTSQSNTNPYRLKLQYSSADMILSKCKQGRAFLREIGWEVEQL